MPGQPSYRSQTRVGFEPSRVELSPGAVSQSHSTQLMLIQADVVGRPRQAPNASAKSRPSPSVPLGQNSGGRAEDAPSAGGSSMEASAMPCGLTLPSSRT